MSIYDNYQTDSAAEQKGAPIVVGATDDGEEIVFYCTRMTNNNPAYAKELERLSKPFARAIDLGTFSNESAKKLYFDAFINVVLVGWKNVKGTDGKDIPYSKETARQVLTDLPDLFTLLSDEARRAANFRLAGMEAAAKNS